MVGNKDKGKLTFYYKDEELFNDVSMLSAYMAKSVVSDAGNVLDDFAITEDERDVYELCVKQTLPNIYEVLVKMCTGVENAFNDNVVIENDETTGLKRTKGKYIELTINDNGAYNKNVLPLVNATINDCLTYGVLVAFYSTIANGALLKLSQDKYSSSILLLNQRLFQLKKKLMSSVLD